MQDLIEARLNRLRQIAQGQEPAPLPESELEKVFWAELDQNLAYELEDERELIEDVWGLTHYR